MNAPTLIASAAAAGTVVALAVQEVSVAAGAPRSTEDIIKIITAVGGLVLIIGGILTPIVTMIVAAKVKNAIDPVVAAVAGVDAKAGAIKASVDGTASRMEATLKAALLTIDQLRADKVDQKEIIIAQATAAPAAITSTGPAASLEQIDQNTAAIEKNTARTEATVTRLEKDQ